MTGGVEAARACGVSHLLLGGQDLLQAHGALNRRHPGVAAHVDRASDVARAVRQERSAVQQALAAARQPQGAVAAAAARAAAVLVGSSAF